MLNADTEVVPFDHRARCRKPRLSLSFDSFPGRVIRLKERSLLMLKQDLILRNPLRLLDPEKDDIIDAGQFGAVLARAGVGKTALAIQIALNSMLRNKNVLHISLNEPIAKVNLWYQEVIERLAQQYQVPNLDQLWDAIVPHRFIMTFQVEGFSAPKLQERLTDLTSQGIFNPDMLIIDGHPFDQESTGVLPELKALAENLNVPAWFTVTTHRHEAPAADGLPVQFSPVKELFQVAIALQPEEDTILIKALQGCSVSEAQPPLVLDPATMLIRQA